MKMGVLMKYTLLIVDDEPKILKTLLRQLSDMDVEILTAESPTTALDIISKVPIDILLTDHKMPDITGLELINRFRNLSSATLPILMSGSYEIETLIEAINKGRIFYFLNKPWKSGEVEYAIKKAIEHRVFLDYQQQIIKTYLVDKEKWLEASEYYEKKMSHSITNTLSAFRRIIEVKDKELFLHSNRVAQYAVGFAEYLNIDNSMIENIRIAAEFHDLGKIVIRDQILYKETVLTTNEYEEMKKHPAIGAEVISQIDLLGEVSLFIMQHHERDDGSGYPNKLKGNEITLGAVIISLSDAYDALTSTRLYKKSMSSEEALQIMKTGGSGKFDETLYLKFEKYTRET